MELFSYLLGKKSGGGGGSLTTLEINNPIGDGMFCSNVKSVPAVTYKGYTAAGMFTYFSSATSFDLSNFDFSGVTNLSSMFSYCSSVEELDLSMLGTVNVTNISSMFDRCINLKKVDLSNFNIVSPLTNTNNTKNMFNQCSSLEKIDIRNFDFANKIPENSLVNMFSVTLKSNCTIIVKDTEQKQFLTPKLTRFNIVTAEEYENNIE